MKNSLKNIVLGIALAGAGLGLTVLSSCVSEPIKIARQEHSDLYREYKSLDMKNLNSKEKEAIDYAKKSYGKLPIPTSELIAKDSNAHEYVEAIQSIQEITGKKAFGEKELVILYRQIKEYIGYPIFY